MTRTRTSLPTAYWRQWSASAISNIGDGMNTAAMPLLAYSLTDDTRLLALVSFAVFVPWFLLALPVGVYVDRFDRRLLMVGANALRAALFAVIAITTATGTLGIGLLLVLLLVVGCCEVVFDSSAQAFLPAIVEPEQLPRANGILFATEVIGNGFVGLPFGAWLWERRSVFLSVPTPLHWRWRRSSCSAFAPLGVRSTTRRRTPNRALAPSTVSIPASSTSFAPDFAGSSPIAYFEPWPSSSGSPTWPIRWGWLSS